MMVRKLADKLRITVNAMPSDKTRFKRGMKRPANSGRKPGQISQTTQIVKEAILIAAELAGNYFRDTPGTKKNPYHVNVHDMQVAGMAAYLTEQAIEYPRSFMPLVAR